MSANFNLEPYEKAYQLGEISESQIRDLREEWQRNERSRMAFEAEVGSHMKSRTIEPHPGERNTRRYRRFKSNHINRMHRKGRYWMYHFTLSPDDIGSRPLSIKAYSKADALEYMAESFPDEEYRYLGRTK